MTFVCKLKATGLTGAGGYLLGGIWVGAPAAIIAYVVSGPVCSILRDRQVKKLETQGIQQREQFAIMG